MKTKTDYSVYLFVRSRERACLRYMGQQTCGPTCALALNCPHFFVRFGEFIS